MNRAESLLERVHKTFKWTKQNLKELEEALIGLSFSYDSLSSLLDETPIIQQKQSFVFLKNEHRLWDSRENWNKFQKRWSLVENIDFEICPKGALVSSNFDGSTMCGNTSRCIPLGATNFNVGNLGSATVTFSFVGNIRPDSSLTTNIPFIPTYETVYSSKMTSSELRITDGLGNYQRSGQINPSNNTQTYFPSFTSTPSSVWSFSPVINISSFEDYSHMGKNPTVAIPIKQLDLSFPSSITQNGLSFGKGVPVPVPPHLDVVCIKFLRQLILS